MEGRNSSIPSSHGDGLASVSLALGIAGLLPLLPFVGSLAAVICGHLALRDAADGASRSRARAGAALGWLGVLVPVVALAVYCLALGYPFPIHRYNGGA